MVPTAVSDAVSEYQWSMGAASSGTRRPASTASTCRPTRSSSARTAKRYDSPLRFGEQCAQPWSDPRRSGRATHPPRLGHPGHDVGRSSCVRLAQYCMAHPPAISAAPISASRWRLKPVEARAPTGDELVVAAVVTALLAGRWWRRWWWRRWWWRRWCRVHRRARPPPELPPLRAAAPCRRRRLSRRRLRRRRRPAGTADRRQSDARCRGPESAAPAAGLAVRISGTTQAAAPAPTTADMRPRAWRLEIRPRSEVGPPGTVVTPPSLLASRRCP